MSRSSQDLRRIAIYTRVSTEEQANKSEGSLDNQAHRCRQYFQVMGNYDDAEVEAAKVYREEGFSGKDMARPELLRLLKDIRAGRVDLLVFTELSRISRSVSDFLAFTRLLKERGVEFISLKERFDTSSPHGKLILLVLMALAEFERETTSLRTRLAMRDRAERGLYNGGAIPIGYRPDPDHSGQLLVQEEEGIIVREAFRLYLELGSVAKVTNLLKERGHRRQAWTSRRGKHHPVRDVSWGTVSGLLQNPTYLALKAVNQDKKNLPEEDALALPEADRYRLVDAVWEPLVDADAFERVQELVAENTTRRGNSVAKRDYDDVLGGIIRCGGCGAGLHGASSKKQSYHYYTHPKGRKRVACGRTGHQAEEIEAAVLDRLSVLADDEDLLDLIVERANTKIEDAAPEKQRDLAAAKTLLDRLKTQQSNLMDHLLAVPAGSVPGSFWKKASELEEQVKAAEVQVHRIGLELSDILSSRLDPAAYRQALRDFREVYHQLDPLQQSNLLAYLLDRVEVTDTHITVAMHGEPPAVAEFQTQNGPGGTQYRQTRRWLPRIDRSQYLGDLRGSAVSDCATTQM